MTDRKKLILDAEEAIVSLHTSTLRQEERAALLGAAVAALESADSSLGVQARVLRESADEVKGTLQSVETSTSLILAGARATFEEERAAFKTHSREILRAFGETQIDSSTRIERTLATLQSNAEESVRRMEAAFATERDRIRRDSDVVIGVLNQQRSAMLSMIGDVRGNAEAAQERVTETYTDARARFERARDEFVDGRKEIIAAASEVRASMIRLESAESEFRSSVAGAVRRIERIVYFGVLVAVAAMVTVLIAR